MSQIILDEGAAPSTPTSGKLALFADTDSRLHMKTAAGIIVPVFDTLFTVVASTSGTAVTFTDIPPEVRSIKILFSGVSLTNPVDLLVQIGDVDGFETTGYSSTSSSSTTSTTGFIIRDANASNAVSGILTLDLIDPAAFEWVSTHTTLASSTNISGAGSKALSAELTQVRVIPSAGSFDAGKINLSYRF